MRILLVIAFVGNQPYLGLATALAGGVILGFVCMRRFDPRLWKTRNDPEM